MKLHNIYLVVLAMTLVTVVVFGSRPRKEEHLYENPVGVACW
jgi:hypothetical protein